MLWQGWTEDKWNVNNTQVNGMQNTHTRECIKFDDITIYCWLQFVKQERQWGWEHLAAHTNLSYVYARIGKSLLNCFMRRGTSCMYLTCRNMVANITWTCFGNNVAPKHKLQSGHFNRRPLRVGNTSNESLRCSINASNTSTWSFGTLLLTIASLSVLEVHNTKWIDVSEMTALKNTHTELDLC